VPRGSIVAVITSEKDGYRGDRFLIGCRDRALLLIGSAAGLRRSELASLEVAQRAGAATGWINQRPDGLAIRLAFSKTDLEAQGDVVGVRSGLSLPLSIMQRAGVRF
jgi:integrase